MPEWLLLTLIAWYINASDGLPYETRHDFRLTQPFHTMIDFSGNCYDVRGENISPQTAWQSIQNVPLAIANENVVTYDDGTCEMRTQ